MNQNNIHMQAKNYLPYAMCVSVFYALLVSLIVFIGTFRLNLYTDRAYTDPSKTESQTYRLQTFKYWHQLMRWDGGWYEQIARQGYSGQETAFFPLYPLLVRSVLKIQNNFASAAGFVSFVSFIAVLYLFLQLTNNLSQEHIKDTKTNGRAADSQTQSPSLMVRHALFFFLFFPTAFYLLAPYTESIFLACLLAALYFVRKQKYLLAGIFSFLTALARVNGFFIIIIIGYELYRQWHIKHASAAQKIAVFCAPIAGFGAYILYLKIRFGNFLQFAASQIRWDRNGSLNPLDISHRLAVYAREFTQLNGAYNAEFASRALDISFFVFIIIISICMWRKWRADFAIWTLSLTILPIFSGTLLSMPRYVFPSPFVAIFLAQQIKNENVRLSLLVCFTTLWTLLLVMFSNGYWVA